MITKSTVRLVGVLLTGMFLGCAVQRPALTKDGVPDHTKRMSIMGWKPDEKSPQEAVVLTFSYPELTSLYHTQTLRRGESLHQYRLDEIQPRATAASLPTLVLTDLDTGKKVVQDPEEKARRERESRARLEGMVSAQASP